MILIPSPQSKASGRESSHQFVPFHRSSNILVLGRLHYFLTSSVVSSSFEKPKKTFSIQFLHDCPQKNRSMVKFMHREMLYLCLAEKVKPLFACKNAVQSFLYETSTRVPVFPSIFPAFEAKIHSSNSLDKTLLGKASSSRFLYNPILPLVQTTSFKSPIMIQGTLH